MVTFVCDVHLQGAFFQAITASWRFGYSLGLPLSAFAAILLAKVHVWIRVAAWTLALSLVNCCLTNTTHAPYPQGLSVCLIVVFVCDSSPARCLY